MTNLKSQRARKTLDILFQAFCVLLGVALMAPVLYCLLISFMQESEIVSTELNLWPETFISATISRSFPKQRFSGSC